MATAFTPTAKTAITLRIDLDTDGPPVGRGGGASREGSGDAGEGLSKVDAKVVGVCPLAHRRRWRVKVDGEVVDHAGGVTELFVRSPKMTSSPCPEGVPPRFVIGVVFAEPARFEALRPTKALLYPEISMTWSDA